MKPIQIGKGRSKVQENNIKAVLVSLFCALSVPTSLASELTVPTSYSNGDTLTADSLNGNFSAVETAVDDNDARISTNESSLGSHASRLDSLEQAGAVSLGHTAFNNDNNAGSTADGYCTLYKGASNYAYYVSVAGATTASCDAQAAVSLPDGKTLTGLHCTLLDNTDLTSLNARLWRTNLNDGTSQNVFTTPETTDNASLVVVSDTTPETAGSEAVDNSTYAYNLFINFSSSDFTSIGSLARIYGCTISYQ